MSGFASEFGLPESGPAEPLSSLINVFSKGAWSGFLFCFSFRLHRKKASPSNASAPTAAAMPTPAFAPLERPVDVDEFSAGSFELVIPVGVARAETACEAVLVAAELPFVAIDVV